MARADLRKLQQDCGIKNFQKIKLGKLNESLTFEQNQKLWEAAGEYNRLYRNYKNRQYTSALHVFERAGCDPNSEDGYSLSDLKLVQKVFIDAYTFLLFVDGPHGVRRLIYHGDNDGLPVPIVLFPERGHFDTIMTSGMPMGKYWCRGRL